MSAPLRVGVVGTRGHAERVAVPTVLANGGMELAAVIGSDPERTAVAARRWRTRGASVADPVDDLGLDAVWITAPNHLHHELAVRYLRAGAHVLLEKPLAIDPDSAAEVVAAAGDSVVRVAYQHRFRTAHVTLRRLIADGGLGDVVSLRIHRYWRFPYFPGQQLSDWRRSDETSGGWVLNDVGSHLVDLVEWLLPGERFGVGSAILGGQVPGVRADSSCLLTFIAGGRVAVQIDCANSLASPGSLVEVYGTDGWVRLGGSFEEHATLTGEMAGERITERFGCPGDAPYAAMADDFVAATAGRIGVGATAQQAARTVGLIDLARRRAILTGELR